MSVTVLFFGPLVDVTGIRTLILQQVTDTDSLRQQLHARYPTLINAQYLLAVDKQITKENTALKDNETVALLPPYAGG